MPWCAGRQSWLHTLVPVQKYYCPYGHTDNFSIALVASGGYRLTDLHQTSYRKVSAYITKKQDRLGFKQMLITMNANQKCTKELTTRYSF